MRKHRIPAFLIPCDWWSKCVSKIVLDFMSCVKLDVEYGLHNLQKKSKLDISSLETLQIEKIEATEWFLMCSNYFLIAFHLLTTIWHIRFLVIIAGSIIHFLYVLRIRTKNIFSYPNIYFHFRYLMTRWLIL